MEDENYFHYLSLLCNSSRSMYTSIIIAGVLTIVGANV